MGIVAVMSLWLCGQAPVLSERTLDQWENRLAETQWVLKDEVTGEPWMLLVLKHYPVNNRIFRLTMYHPADRTVGPRMETWTGSYKMEARRASDDYDQDAIKLVRLQADRRWWPVNWIGRCDLVRPLLAANPMPWPASLVWVDWLEQDEFRPFFAELVFEAPFLPAAEEPQVQFLLRSDEVLGIGWWKIGTVYRFSPVPKFPPVP